MPYPPHVPVFSQSDIRKGAFGEVPPHDSVRWLSTLFGYGTAEYKRAYSLLFEVIDGEAPGYVPAVVGEMTALILWNESSLVSRRKIAETLNEVMRRLGYTEIEEIDSWEWV